MLMSMARGIPDFVAKNLNMNLRLAAMSEEDVDELHEEQRQRMHKTANLYMHSIEAMSSEERERTQNDGVLEMYTPENLKIRQELYVYNQRINAWLERWWSAAARFLDRDHSHTLTLDEYAEVSY